MMKNRKMRTAIVHTSILIIGVLMGIYAHAWYYDDICLDLGGGRNPGGYPICVVEVGK